MVALVVASTFVVLVLGILVAGLLRSMPTSSDRSTSSVSGVGDPADTDGPPVDAVGAAAPVALNPPVALTPPSSSPPLGAAPTIAGVTPTGDARAISVTNSDGFTLVAFLSSGCATCAGFWEALQQPGVLALPNHSRAGHRHQGPDREVPSEVRAPTAASPS